MANLANFKLPKLSKNSSEVKYLFKIGESIFLMGSGKFLLKIKVSIAENWLNKKNHLEHKYSIFFESRNNYITLFVKQRAGVIWISKQYH